MTARKTSTKRKQKIRSPHPGVVLTCRVLASGAKAYRARFSDPDTGRLTFTTLDLVALPTQEARRAWAIERAKSLAKRRMEIASGAHVIDARPIAKAIESYEETSKARLRDRTRTTYKLALDQLERWSKTSGVDRTDKLTGPKLGALREYLIAQPRKSAAKGSQRGGKNDTAHKRSPISINRELRTLKTVLNAWRQQGLLPNVNRDTIGDALKMLQTARTQPEYLTQRKLRELLDAARDHDRDKFKATRRELKITKVQGVTDRYVPIADFTVFLLLTGCRRGEALSMKWGDVNLDAKDHNGRKVGEIRLLAEHTKTHHDRTIGLEVSPALLTMLIRMKEHAKGAHVFCDADGGPYTADLVDAARGRMIESFGAPKFTWQLLRSTCATYLTNAPSIFGAATVFLSAKQLGHSVMVAEKHYLGVHRSIHREARTLEAAMEVEGIMKALNGEDEDAAGTNKRRTSRRERS